MGSRCYCTGFSCGLPVLVGIIAGILAVVFAPVFTAITAFLWIAFGVSLLFLLILLGVLYEANGRERDAECCVCRYGRCLLVGTFGTLVSSIVALAVGTLTGTLGAVLGFLVVGFLAWSIVALFLLVLCIIDELCD